MDPFIVLTISGNYKESVCKNKDGTLVKKSDGDKKVILYTDFLENVGFNEQKLFSFYWKGEMDFSY